MGISLSEYSKCLPTKGYGITTSPDADGCPRVPPRKNASGAVPSYLKPLIRILLLSRANTVPATLWVVLVKVPIFLGPEVAWVSVIFALNCARPLITFLWLFSTSDSNSLRASKTV